LTQKDGFDIVPPIKRHLINIIWDFAPIGILERWNGGIMGSGKIRRWSIGRTPLRREIYEYFNKQGIPSEIIIPGGWCQ
jgi:hypothetical protein